MIYINIIFFCLLRGTSKDPAHEPFRKWFAHIGEIRSLLPTPPMLAITATASRRSRRAISKSLSMISAREIVENPDRPNIKLYRHKVPSFSTVSEIFAWLLKTEARTIIFTKTIKDCAKVYVSLQDHMQNSVDMFHSCSTDITKERIRTDMADPNGKFRVLVATDAAGMGVNFAGISCVVNYGPPAELDALLQHIGRAGRDGSPASHLLLFNGRQVRNCSAEILNYVRVNQCLRKCLLEPYNCSPIMPVSHSCCDFCAKECNCNDEHDHEAHPATMSVEAVEHEDWWHLSQEDLDSIRSDIIAYRASLPSSSLVPLNLSSGLSNAVIDQLLSTANKIVSAEDILLLCPGIGSYGLAKDVWEIMCGIIEDAVIEEDDDNDYIDDDDKLFV